jgi:hypothetical protein
MGLLDPEVKSCLLPPGIKPDAETLIEIGR